MIQQKISYDGIIFENLNLFSEDVLDLLLQSKLKDYPFLVCLIGVIDFYKDSP